MSDTAQTDWNVCSLCGEPIVKMAGRSKDFVHLHPLDPCTQGHKATVDLMAALEASLSGDNL